MSFINVLFKRVTTAIRGTEAIEDGKILLDYERPSIYVDNGSTRVELTPRDTELSTTSTNAIANNALTNSIINTTAEVNAITADNIPCGTKPVKELITSLPFTPEISSGNMYHNSSCRCGFRVYLQFMISGASIPGTGYGVIGTLPVGYRPSATKWVNIFYNSTQGQLRTHGTAQINTDGTIYFRPDTGTPTAVDIYFDTSFALN